MSVFLPHTQKNNWCLDLASWIFSTFWHFNLKGHSLPPICMCDTVGAANYSESTTKHKCDTAQTCKYGKKTRYTSLPVTSLCFTLFLSFLFLSPAFLCPPAVFVMTYQHQASLRESSNPIIVKKHQQAVTGMCLALGYFSPVFWMSRSWRLFRGPALLQNNWAPILLGPCRQHISLNGVRAREEIEIIKVHICIFLENDSKAQGNALCRTESKLLFLPFLPLLIRLVHQP